MRSNKLYFLILVLLMVLVFSILSSAQRVVTLSSDPMDSGTYAGAAGISNIINMYNKVGLMLKVKPTTGALEANGLIIAGEVEISAYSQDYAQPAWLTKGDFQVYDKMMKIIPARLLFGAPMDYFGTYTINGTGILTGADLKGKKVVTDFTAESWLTSHAKAFLANWGLTTNDVINVTVSGMTSATSLVLEGRADANTGGPAGGDMTELDAVKGVRFLSLNTTPEALKAFEDVCGGPFTWEWVDPSLKITGVRERTALVTTRDLYLCRGDKISDEEAYAIVEAVWDHMDLVTAINVDFARFTKPEMLLVGIPTIPYHPGAIKFYKEKGLWTKALEDKQAELLALEEEEKK
jgi:TRAP transporter TAXI family solute receptor